MRWTSLLVILIGVLVMATACSEEKKTEPAATAGLDAQATATSPAAEATETQVLPEPTQAPPQQQEQPPEEIELRIAIFDDSAERPLISGLGTSANSGSRAELWVRGYGSWFPDLEFGGDGNTLGSFPIGEEHEFFVYPDGRDGREIRVVFRMTADMISGSDRDMIQIGISDTTVTVSGTAIRDFEQQFER